MTIVPFVPRAAAKSSTPQAMRVLGVVADARTPVFLTTLVVAGEERRRFCHWQPWSTPASAGNCYRLLSAADCDALIDAGLLTLGAPVRDGNRTVRAVCLTRSGRAALCRLAVAA